jgi:tellurite resistance protein TerC
MHTQGPGEPRPDVPALPSGRPAHRPDADASGRAAGSIAWVVVWVGLGLGLGLWFAVTQGTNAAAEYYAAYLLEKALSVDNLFVFVVIFSALQIPREDQHRVLRLGIAGALVLRAVMIGAGIALVERFHWIIYPFAALILLAALRLLFGEKRERRVVTDSCAVCGTWLARIVRVSPVLHGHDFWRRDRGRLVATPLFVALILIETTDIVFALDSIPAVLAVTRNPLIVYSSNVMAMLGLRSLFFVVSDGLDRLRYLRHGLAAVLAFTGVKMLASRWVHVGAVASLAVIGTVLAAAVAASLWRTKQGAAG